MFVVNDDLSIYLTRGDTLFFNVRANDNGYPYTFKPGDIVRISVTAKKDVTNVYIQKDFPVYKACKKVFIYLEGSETKIGEKINKYKDYWYEIVLNPDTVPQTIIGNNDEGAKIFRLFPEADDVEEEEILPEEIPVVDAELDLLSDRPVSNRAVSAAIARLTAAIEELKGNIPNLEEPDGSVFNALGQVEGLSFLAFDAYGVAVKNGFVGTPKAWLASLHGKDGTGITAEALQLLIMILQAALYGSDQSANIRTLAQMLNVYVPDEPETPKLAAPVIRLETDSSNDSGDEGDSGDAEDTETTPAILGVAVLGRTILGDYGESDSGDSGELTKLDTPVIRLEADLPKLTAPVISLESDPEDTEEEPTVTKLDTPVIALETVVMVLDAPVIELVEV